MLEVPETILWSRKTSMLLNSCSIWSKNNNNIKPGRKQNQKIHGEKLEPEEKWRFAPKHLYNPPYKPEQTQMSITVSVSGCCHSHKLSHRHRNKILGHIHQELIIRADILINLNLWKILCDGCKSR